jgi:hypothetical protein
MAAAEAAVLPLKKEPDNTLQNPKQRHFRKKTKNDGCDPQK